MGILDFICYFTIEIAYSLRFIMNDTFIYFTHSKKKCINERERKIVLNILSSINAFSFIINAK